MSAGETLKTVADEAYRLYPNSCSHAVWHVMKQYIPDQKYLTANVLLTYLECDPRWQLVPVGDLEKHATNGELVVGGLIGKPNGHVVVVYPGKASMAGGYTATVNGKPQMIRRRGPFALVMSTSLGSWPGAMSKGDKTVWDPWGTDTKFSMVKFWRFDSTVKKAIPKC